MIHIPCARCGKTWPEDAKHPGYPDVHHCSHAALPAGVYRATVQTLIISEFFIGTVIEIEGGPHDGELLIFKQRRTK